MLRFGIKCKVPYYCKKPLSLEEEDHCGVTKLSINSHLISEVERLFNLLQENKFIEKETKDEINLTIQEYMEMIREFQTIVE